MVFKSKQKKFDDDLKVRLCDKRLHFTESVNTWKLKMMQIGNVKLKIRKYVCPKILRSICFAIFESNPSYCSLVWAQNFRTIQRIVILQKKAVIRIINFQPGSFHTSPLFKQSSILKFQDKICLENILLVSKSVKNLTPSVLNTCFSFSSDQHNYGNQHKELKF